MQVILNSIAVLLIYFSLQILLFRFLKINLNKPSFILFIIIISVFIAFYSFSLEVLMNLISINLMIISFYIIMTGIVNHSPALVIIDLIFNKKINQKKFLKIFFFKSSMNRAVEKRLKINISSNFIYLKKGKFFIKKNAKIIVIFSNLLKKIYNLKSDV